MKKRLITYLVFSVFVLFFSCKNQEQDNIEAKEIETPQNTPTEFKNSALRNGGKIEIGVIYTDTVQFIEFNDNYDDFLFIVSKEADTIPLIYNNVESNFMIGEQIEIKWKIDSLRPAGDPEYLTYADYLVSARRIKENLAFKPEFYKLPLKKLPVVDSTSFDSFIEVEDYKSISAEAFQLPYIYKNWYNEAYNFKAISGYRLEFSKDFYTAVLTVKKGDNEMETTLINYNLEGNIIDYKLIAYDEIAESISRCISIIESDSITQKYKYVASEFNMTVTDTTVFNIDSNGKFNKLSRNSDTILDFLANELKIENSKRIQKLETFKKLPNDNEVIVVIPEIVEEDEEYFELNTHIAIYNIEMGKITHQYFESSKTNDWTSDAIRIDGITINKKVYLVKEDTNAFGIMVEYSGSSRVNPYYKRTLSLFVKENGKLINILHNYNFEVNTGEWNGACEGEFHDEKTEFIFTTDKTNNYFDIIVKKTLTKTTNFETEIGDCDYNEEIKRETSVLKFDGNLYK